MSNMCSIKFRDEAYGITSQPRRGCRLGLPTMYPLMAIDTFLSGTRTSKKPRCCQPNLISIRYRWVDEEDKNVYFEFSIHTAELTGATTLEITDFAEPHEQKDSINLWDSQIEGLKRTLGI